MYLLTEKKIPSLFMGLQLMVERQKFIPSLVQRKKSYSWQPKFLIVYKKLIYPFTYTWEFTRHLTTTFQKFLHFSSRKINDSMRRQNKKYLSLYLYKGKIGHLYAQTKQKRPMHPRTTKPGVQSASRSVRIVHVCISLWIAPFVFQIYATASWVLYLNTENFICQKIFACFLCLLWSRF